MELDKAMKSKSTTAKTIITLFVFVPVMALFLTLFLFIGYMIPLDEENYAKSINELSQQGWYTNVLELRPGDDKNFFSDQPGIQNISNDMADYQRAKGYPDKSPVYNALAMGHDDAGNYARYWHGYAGILRLLLHLFDSNEIKFLCFSIQFLLVALVLLIIKEKVGVLPALLFVTQYVLLMPLVVSVAMTFTFSIDLSLLGIIIYSHFHEFIERSNLKWLFFCLVGIMTCFLEELTFGVLTWGMIVVWAIIIYGKEYSCRNNVKTVMLSGLSWIWGYGGIWVMKWIIATIILKENVIRDGIETVLLRSSESNEISDAANGLFGLVSRYQALSENYKYYYYPVFFVILATWVLFLSFRFLRKNSTSDSRIPALGLVALAPIVWYFMLANHTLGHRFFTYRVINFGIIAVLAIVLISCDGRSGEGLGKEFINKRSAKLAVLILSVLFGAVLASCKHEDYESKNLEIAGDIVPFSAFENGVISVSMKPQTRYIKSLGIVIYPGSSDCTYELRLLSGGEVVYTEDYSKETFLESNWRVLGLDWKVNPRKDYVFEIVPICDGEDSGSVAVCFPNGLTVDDLGVISTVTEMPTTQLTYWMFYSKVVSGNKWIFYFLTWFVVFECISLVTYNLKITKRLNRTNEE